MKNSKDSSDKNKKIIISVIISLLIGIPLVYLLNYNARKLSNAKNAVPITTVSNTSEDPIVAKLQAAEELVKTLPSETNYVNLSLLYYNNKQWNECAEASKKAIEYNPKSYFGYNNLCAAYNCLGKWDDAIAAGNKALEIKPGDLQAKNNLQISINEKAKAEKIKMGN